MAHSDHCSLVLRSPRATELAGISLGQTLYQFPLDIALIGELGAGKTTFLRGFLRGLMPDAQVRSPTFAIQQHYDTSLGVLRHMDLYRLSKAQSEECLAWDNGSLVRCIEWAQRVPMSALEPCRIVVLLRDAGLRQRIADIRFEDCVIPSKAQIVRWRTECALPRHIRAHCDAVARLSLSLAQNLLRRGIIVRAGLLVAAAKVHDLLRFVDFLPEASPKGFRPSCGTLAIWGRLRERYKAMGHEEACVHFLRDQGYPALANIVATHGARMPVAARHTVEQKLLFYADKRICGTKIVTLNKRAADFSTRYERNHAQKQRVPWLAQAREIERTLLR